MKQLIIVGLMVGFLGIIVVLLRDGNLFKQHASNELSIAIFTPTTHGALEEIERGFKEQLRSYGDISYRFTTFNANGNRTLLRAQAEELVSGSYDLICTIGLACSQAVAELAKKKGIRVQQVFTGIDGIEVAQMLTLTNEDSTGLYLVPNYAKELDIVLKLQPQIKRMVLVYDPAHGAGLEQHKNNIEQHLRNYSVSLQSVEVYQTNEIQQKVSGYLSSSDAVLVLVDNTVVAGIDALVTLCSRYGIPLITSDLISGARGASFAFGINEYEFGSGAAEKAHEILAHHKKVQDLSAQAVTSFRFELHEEAMRAQNVEIDGAVLDQIRKECQC